MQLIGRPFKSQELKIIKVKKNDSAWKNTSYLLLCELIRMMENTHYLCSSFIVEFFFLIV